MINRKKKRLITGFLLVGLLCALAFQCVSSMLGKSNTFDEPKLIEFGSAFWKDRRIPFPPHHYPLLLPVLETAPLIFLQGINHPEKRVDDLGKHFLWDLNREQAKLIINLCRLPVVFLSLLLGFFVFKFANDCFGIKSALLALFLYVFSPNIIAHSRYVHMDLGGACFGFISVYYFWKFIEAHTRKNAVILGITLGLALLSKHSNLILIPSFAIIAILKAILAGDRATTQGQPSTKKRGILLSLCVIFVVAIFTIGLFYSFIRGISGPKASAEMVKRFGPPSQVVKVVDFVADHLFLRAYWDGLRELHRHAQGGHSAFLMGNYSFRGWWYYYFICFLIKTPIPFLLLLFIAICYYKRFEGAGLLRDALLLTPVLIIFLISTGSGQNIGHRHILFVYPLLYVFVSGIANIQIATRSSRRMYYALIGALCIWYAGEAAMIYPHYLAYFNEFVGGPKNGYKYLADSNLDWGQDLEGLKDYMHKNGISKIKLAYFGTSDPTYYNINYEYLPCSSLPRPPGYRWNIPTKGLIAISATELQSVYFVNKRTYEWLRKYEPIDTIGYSILIYDIR